MNSRKISAVIVARNEEHNIRVCLETVRWADEIVVVDNFSTDRTQAISREFTDKIFQHEFHGFGQLRNDAVAHASFDWVFSLDADERATPELADEIRQAIESGPPADGYFIPRRSHFLGHWIRHCGWYPDYRQLQLFRKSRMRYRDDVIHEGFDLNGQARRLNNYVLHYPFRDIDHYVAKQNRYSDLMARRMAKQGRQFSSHQLITHPLAAFLKMYVQKAGFLDGMPGLILSGLYAYYTVMKYAKLWELSKDKVSV